MKDLLTHFSRPDKKTFVVFSSKKTLLKPLGFQKLKKEAIYTFPDIFAANAFYQEIKDKMKEISYRS